MVRETYNDIRGYLQLAARVVEREGRLINEGEEFVVRCTVTNTAPPRHQTNDPPIVFLNPWVSVRGGAHARPSSGGYVHLDLPDNSLSPGESTSADVEFEATGEIGNWTDLWREEDIADMYIHADLDYDRMFSDFQRKVDFSSEIHPS